MKKDTEIIKVLNIEEWRVKSKFKGYAVIIKYDDWYSGK